jgi:hypothetical protein
MGVPVSTPLQLFLARLATDPASYEEYQRNPDEIMHEAGLSRADQAALKTCNPEAIAAQLEAGGSASTGFGGSTSTWPMAQPPGAATVIFQVTVVPAGGSPIPAPSQGGGTFQPVPHFTWALIPPAPSEGGGTFQPVPHFTWAIIPPPLPPGGQPGPGQPAPVQPVSHFTYVVPHFTYAATARPPFGR